MALLMHSGQAWVVCYHMLQGCMQQAKGLNATSCGSDWSLMRQGLQQQAHMQKQGSGVSFWPYANVSL